MKPVRILACMTPAARVVIEGLAAQLEEIAAKGNPLSVADEICSWRILLAASQILSEMDSTVMTDEAVNRLRVAYKLVESLAPEGERTIWIN
jgi:hypothetical protein